MTVAEELNFRKAAERLHMTQPPLSQQIAALEEELGVKLFQRNRRWVRLTDAGKSLLRDTRDILASIEAARRRTIDIGRGKSGRLRIGYVGPAIDGPLATDMNRFSAHSPNIDLELHESSTTRQIRDLRNGTIDLGVVRLVGHDTMGLESEHYHSERYVLAVPEKSPLALSPDISLSSLDQTPLIFFPRSLNPVLFDAWAGAFSTADARMNIAQEATTKHSSVALVAAGHGVTPVPESTASTGRKGVVFIPLTGDIPALSLHMVYSQHRTSPLLESFLKFLRGKPTIE